MSPGETEYTYLRVPPVADLRACVGLVLAGMAARARIGVGGLEEAVELLEGFHSESVPTSFRFAVSGDTVIAEVEEFSEDGGSRWRTVVELVS
ncbi:hypothetical protein Rxycam_00394 [Rubrobacter xylanophilus DSM 9941]|uniref:hypothetical protein n=1 Tax=Rubrobacter xylanophilus TaxID=49319 RepID=UPI001C6434BC|nr:hypothetical protein [Rubrobacter xylanophilus]QYJ14592.1 hypothetical protein Rxycam_00394 [Rubrobacter xylanophilus DSM 9941]